MNLDIFEVLSLQRNSPGSFFVHRKSNSQMTINLSMASIPASHSAPHPRQVPVLSLLSQWHHYQMIWSSRMNPNYSYLLKRCKRPCCNGQRLGKQIKGLQIITKQASQLHGQSVDMLWRMKKEPKHTVQKAIMTSHCIFPSWQVGSIWNQSRW